MAEDAAVAVTVLGHAAESRRAQDVQDPRRRRSPRRDNYEEFTPGPASPP
ncbi:hypothetical protein [Actinoplanes regularis]|nr:hypothetical protein [Actinoplanes regularis]GIE88932.1 hypothetical protein Are01nite_54120 [Actinoplanes regularis]